MQIKFKRLVPDAIIPCKAHVSDSGMDLYSAEHVTISPCDTVKIRTGIAAVIPEGYELQVRPRSGMSSRGIIAAFGTVDNGYRGEICVTLYNFGDYFFDVNEGDRIAQLVLAPVIGCEILEETGDLGSTDRGANGFGSTGR